MNKLGASLAILIAASTGVAHSADLTAAKAPAPNCWASVWTWLNSSATDCPISAYGITLYGALDVGYGYQEWGAPRSPNPDKLQYGIRSNAYEHIWQATYSNLSADVIGLKMKEDLARIGLPGWSLIGVLEAGINPYSGMFFNGPRSLADANTTSNTGLIAINGRNYYFNFQKTNLDFESRRIVGQFPGIRWTQQSDLGNPDLRPNQLADLRYAVGL